MHAFTLNSAAQAQMSCTFKRVLEIWHCMAFLPPPPPKPLLDSCIERCSIGPDKFHALD